VEITFWNVLFFLDIATVVGFYAVSIPFMNRNSSLSNLSQNERFRVSTVLTFSNKTHMYKNKISTVEPRLLLHYMNPLLSEQISNAIELSEHQWVS